MERLLEEGMSGLTMQLYVQVTIRIN